MRLPLKKKLFGYWYWPWWAISELWFFQQILKEAAKQSGPLALAICYFTVYRLGHFFFQLTDVMSALVPSLAVFFLAIEWLIKIGLYGLVAALILPFLKPYFGLLERIFLYASNIYILIFFV